MRKETQGTEDRELHVVDLNDASKAGCWIVVPIFLLYFIPYYFIWYPRYSGEFWKVIFDRGWDAHPLVYLLAAIVAVVVGIVLHELIHGAFWAMFAKRGWRSIRFGIIKEYVTPYCHCKEPLQVKHYIIGGLMPLILLGIVPGVWAWFSGDFYLLLFGFFFTVSAIGDVLVIKMLWKFPKNSYVQDHPTEAGFYVYKKRDL